MLRTRILTALLIIPATIALVFFLPEQAFRLAIAVFLLIGSWEFARLAGLAPGGAVALLILQSAILAGIHYFWGFLSGYMGIILAAGVLAWLVMFSRLVAYQGNESPDSRYRLLGFLSAIVSITFCWISLVWLRGLVQGPFVVFLLLLIIWAADVGAYFAGRFLGKTPLAIRISPKKTREGVYGGIVLAIAAAFVWAWPISKLDLGAAALVVGATLTALASVGGDLFISVHKRTVGLKDSGALFPGHGGVLDRYDSLLAGAPFFAWVTWFLGT